MNSKTKNILSLIINAFIGISGLVSIILISINSFSSKGDWHAFRYYTNLSNIFLFIACLIALIYNIKVLVTKKYKPNKIVTLIKYNAVITTTITLIIVMVFLGPVIGYKAMFADPTLILYHGVNPFLGVISLIFLDDNYKIDFKDTLIAISPTFAYGLFYIPYMILVEDFYQFNKFGPFVCILIMLFIVGLAFGQATLYKFILNKKIKVRS